MDCTICLDENIHQENITNLECGHTICINCYNKLVRNLCPFCRNIISCKVDGSYNINYDNLITDDFINNIYESDNQIDNILPQSEINNYDDDMYSTYYTFYTESYVMRRLNKRKCKKNKNKRNSNNFVSNKNRDEWQRKSKKFKKRRSYH